MKQRFLWVQSWYYSCTWEPVIKEHPPVSLIAIRKGESISTDVTRNWAADVYLCARAAVKTSQAVYECFMCICLRACDGTPTGLMLFSRLTWQSCLCGSHSEDRWQGLTPLRNSATHTHTETWCTTRELPWHPLACLSIQQWVMRA